MKSIFPDPNLASEEGLLTVGGFITPEILIDAYSNGIFPWHNLSRPPPGLVFTLTQEVLLTLMNLPPQKISQNPSSNVISNLSSIEILSKSLRSVQNITHRNFSEETWITPEIIEGYIALFNHGNAYSAETYLDGELVGGLYGVHIAVTFQGSRCFYEQDNASKFALMELLKILKENKCSFFDTQMVTPITERFGAKEISRAKFLSILQQEREKTIQPILINQVV